jgi:hypothetical protein
MNDPNGDVLCKCPYCGGSVAPRLLQLLGTCMSMARKYGSVPDTPLVVSLMCGNDHASVGRMEGRDTTAVTGGHAVLHRGAETRRSVDELVY